MERRWLAGLYALSTPHGTLGTFQKQAQGRSLQRTFNSTRYIRNLTMEEMLSALGVKSFNSTRYIRN